MKVVVTAEYRVHMKREMELTQEEFRELKASCRQDSHAIGDVLDVLNRNHIDDVHVNDYEILIKEPIK